MMQYLLDHEAYIKDLLFSDVYIASLVRYVSIELAIKPQHPPLIGNICYSTF